MFQKAWYSKLTLIHYQPKLELFALSGWIDNFSKVNWVLISGIINVNLNGCFIVGLNPLPLVHKQSYNYFLSYTHIPVGIFVLPVIRLKQGFPMYIFHDPNYMYIVSKLYIYYKLFSLWPLGTVQNLNDQSTKSSNFYFYSRKLWGFKSCDGSVYKYFAIRIWQ